MRTSELKRLLEKAGDRKAKSACLAAVLVCYHKELVKTPPLDLCRELGLPDSYKHTVRVGLQVQQELEQLGFEVNPATNS